MNDVPLRKKAASDCTKAMAKLDRARAELRRFESEDSPAFGQWMAATFGPLLTKLRECTRLIIEKEQLIQEVEMEQFCEGGSLRKAYATVMYRREHPPQQGAEDYWRTNSARSNDSTWEEEPADFTQDDFPGDEIPESEAEAMFEDFLRSAFGVIPDEISPDAYEDFFTEFKQQVLGRKAGNGAQGHSAQSKTQRIKEIYRVLVRRLHPDMNRDKEVAAIWHEVQEAYESRNLERMETLLALTEIQTGINGGKASLSHMRAAVAELRRALQSIQKSLREARLAPAWGFTQKKDHSALEKRVRKELEQDIFSQSRHLSYLETIIEKWSRPAKRKHQNNSKQSANAPKEKRDTGQNAKRPGPFQTELFSF